MGHALFYDDIKKEPLLGCDISFKLKRSCKYRRDFASPVNTPDTAMALEQSIHNLVDLFLKYADGDGKLSKEELMKMVENETTNPEIKAKMASGEMAKCMGKLNKKCDGELKFGQFAGFVRVMLKCAYKKETGRQEPEDED